MSPVTRSRAGHGARRVGHLLPVEWRFEKNGSLRSNVQVVFAGARVRVYADAAPRRPPERKPPRGALADLALPHIAAISPDRQQARRATSGYAIKT
jgi:hypothetical protein